MTLAPTLVAGLLVPVRAVLCHVPFLVANVANVRLLTLLGQMARFRALVAAVLLLGALSGKVAIPGKKFTIIQQNCIIQLIRSRSFGF